MQIEVFQAKEWQAIAAICPEADATTNAINNGIITDRLFRTYTPLKSAWSDTA